MNKTIEFYFIGTLVVGMLFNYLLAKTPNIIYKGSKNQNGNRNKNFSNEHNSKCFNENLQEIKCSEKK